jgi:tRNA (guanine-N7-)-methyltransferase
LRGEYSEWSYDEERAPTFRGQWREKSFKAPDDAPLDLEIGTGNGLHFAHHATSHPDRCLIGLELRYKPLIQSIRRARRAGGMNARIARYNAYLLPELFISGEVNDVYLFFPDPWEKGRNHKHRIVQDEFMIRMYEMQRPGSYFYFKTDSRDYFEWSLRRFQRSQYEIEAHTFDLHNSPLAEGNFVTQFEKIFIRQGVPIGYARLRRP